MGPDVDPESGGGKLTCCVMLPATWRPGLHVKVQWKYAQQTELSPILPSQTAELEVPKYGKSVGDLHVHFYGDHKVKIVVSNCTVMHPFYPMDKESLRPWKARRSKEEHLKWEKEAGEKDDC
jgi:hypothetical protein